MQFWALVFLILFSLETGSAFASVDTEWEVKAWQPDNGFPHNDVAGIAQSRDGFLWLATSKSFIRFDGLRFEEFPLRTFLGKNATDLRVAVQGPGGTIWAATSAGTIFRIRDGKTDSFSEGLPQLIVDNLLEDREGALWITYRFTMDEPAPITAVRLKEGEVTAFSEKDGLPARYCSLTLDAQGQIWFFSGGHLGIFRNNRFETLKQLPDVGTRIVADREKGVWVCSGLRLLKYDPDGDAELRATLNPNNPTVRATVMLQDRSGSIWIGTSHGGLFRYEDGRVENVPSTHRQVSRLFEDSEGNIWAGSSKSGLNRLQPRALTLEGGEASVPFERIQSICQDRSGTIWGCTQDGILVRRNANGWKEMSDRPDLRWQIVTCVAADPQSGIWIGTSRQILYHLEDGKVTKFRDKDGLDIHIITGLLPTQSGDIWLAGERPDQVQRFHQGKFEEVTLPPRCTRVRAMAEDNSGNIWLGALRGMLMRIAPNSLVPVVIPVSFKKQIRCLFPAPDGSLWMGFEAPGLGYFKDCKFDQLTTDRGLFDSAISQIVMDRQDHLWFGTDHGIFRASHSQLDDLTNGRVPTTQFLRFAYGVDFPVLRAESDYTPRTLLSDSGRLWMPMRTALAVISPGKVRENVEAPPVFITKVALDEQPITSNMAMLPGVTAPDLRLGRLQPKLTPNHREITFDFTALSYCSPESLNFRYRLEGYDAKWVEAGPRRTATYPRLPAGSYRFQVIAANNTGVWNHDGASLAFTIAPFYWQTWWFRTFMLATFTGTVAGAVRQFSFRRLQAKVQMLRQEAAIHKERARIARDIHDDVGNRLTSIMLLSGLTLRNKAKPSKVDEHVRQISKTARQVTDSLDEIVWAVNPGNDTLIHLLNYIARFAVEFLETAGIQCRLDLPPHPPARIVSTEIRHGLFLAVKEALHNVVRHAQAQEVRIRVLVELDNLSVDVADDGKGITNNAEQDGADGIRNMQQRIAEISGHCEIQSHPGSGTTISFQVPLPPDR